MTTWMDRFLRAPEQHLHPRQMQVALEIEVAFGDTVYFQGRAVPKFGKNNDSDADIKSTIMSFQGTGIANETLPTSETIDFLVSDNAADSGKTLSLEGHYRDGENNLVFTVQTVTCAGLTPVALATPLIRATRLGRPYLHGTGALAGNVYVYDSTEATGVTSGTPDVATATKIMIDAGEQQSQKCSTAISGTQYWAIDRTNVALDRATGAGTSAMFDIETKHYTDTAWSPGGVNIVLRRDGTTHSIDVLHERLIRPNSDVRMVATASANNTTTYGAMFGYLYTLTRPTTTFRG